MIALVAVLVIGLLLLLMYYCKSKPESKLLTDKDGGYAGIKDCYFDQKKYYPELDIITKNFEVIRQELFGMNGSQVNLKYSLFFSSKNGLKSLKNYAL
jgi:hypothetical protein